MREILCPECGSAVSYGRLSCPSCGSLLASVAGAPRRSLGRAGRDAPEDAEASLAVEDEPFPDPRAATPPAPLPETTAETATEPDMEPPIDVSMEAESAPAALGERPAGPERPADTTVGPDSSPVLEPPGPVAALEPTAAATRPGAVAAGAAASRVPLPRPPHQAGPPAILREWQGPPPPSYRAPADLTPALVPAPRAGPPGEGEADALEAVLSSELPIEAPARSVAAAEPLVVAPAQAAPPSGSQPPPARPLPYADLPGAYLPPSAAFRTPPASQEAAPGRAEAAWSGAPGPVTEVGSPGALASAPLARPFGATLLATSPAPQAKSAPTPGQAPILADLPFQTPDDMPGWLVLAGSVAAAVSFLLPWASSGGQVIGGPIVLGYFDGWGLATVTDLVLFILALLVLVLAVVPRRVPAAVRGGILPLLLAGAFLGTGWLYLGLPYGYGPGIPILVAGGILLLVGGVLTIRHAAATPPVQ